MTRIANLLRITKNKSGAVATEYTFVVAFIAIIAATGMTTLGLNIEGFFNNIGDGLGDAGDEILLLSDGGVSGPGSSGPSASGPSDSGPSASGPSVSGPGSSEPGTSGPGSSGQALQGQAHRDQTHRDQPHQAAM